MTLSATSQEALSLKEVVIVREAIAKITKILAGKDIPVTQQGAKAFVQHSPVTKKIVRVNLPYIPDNATHELIAAVNGFLDHEVGHILFTDFEAMEGAGAELSESERKVFMGIHNVVEDTWIERAMVKKFRGSASNLDNVGDFFIRRFVHPKFVEAMEAGDFKAAGKLLMMPAMRAWAGHTPFKEYMKDKWGLISDMVDMIGEDIIAKLPTIESTKQALEVAAEVHTRLKKGGATSESEKEGDSEGKSSGKSKDSDEEKSCKAGSSSSDGEKDGDKSEKKKSGSDESKGEGDESESAESKSSGKKEEESESDSESEESESKAGEPESDESEPEPDEPESDESEPEPELGDDAGGEPESDADKDESTSEDKPDYESGRVFAEAIASSEFEEKVGEILSDDAKELSIGAPYLIFTKDQDRIEPFTYPEEYYRPGYLARLEDNTSAITGTLQKTMERLMVARSMKRWMPGQRRGRVSASSLYRLKTGDDRVFRKREEKDAVDTAVMLVLDCSSSMSGTPITNGAMASFALANVLERLNIPSALYGFTTLSSDRVPRSYWAELAAEERRIGRKYTRSEPLYVPIFKGFNERMTPEVKKRIAMIQNAYFLANNIDGECVELAGFELLKRTEKKKVMIVLSDGYPAGHGDMSAMRKHLKDTVKKMKDHGIIMIGIGLNSYAVKDFYPEYTVINDVSELPARVMNELKAHLLGK